jgi:hypothetical protein
MDIFMSIKGLIVANIATGIDKFFFHLEQWTNEVSERYF